MQALSTLFSEFNIRLEEPAKEYFPGEEVRGAIIVQSTKTIKSSAVRLKLKGKVTSKSKEYDFCLFEKEVPVNEQSKIEKFLHFSFSLILPSDIPSSCVCSGYAITYTLKASLQTVSWLSEAFLPKCSTEIKILDDINITNFPPPIVRPFQIEVKGKKKNRGFAHINVEISKGAIMRGQSVPIRIHIKHITPIKNLEGILVALCKRTKLISKDGKEVTTRKIVASTISPILIDPNTLDAIINTKLTVPHDIPPTIKNARFFFVSYSIEVSVDLTIKKTIFESSNKVGKRDYSYLKKKLGKYVGCFYIPLVIGTTDNGDYDYNNNNIDSVDSPPSPPPPPLHHHHHHNHNRRPSEWTIGSIGSTNNQIIDPSFLSVSSHYHHDAISWDGTISPVPSAPSVDELEVYDDIYYSRTP